MNTMQYDELPSMLKARVNTDNFLSAYSINDSDRVIVWIVNNQLGKQEELEFSKSENKLLSVEEREAVMPIGKTVIISKLGVEVTTEYKLEEGTNVLYEVYKIHSIESKTIIGNASQIYFTPYKSSLEEIVKSTLDDYQFPLLYKEWDENEKINYWVDVLYRLRRQTGESGGHEDDVFDKSLLEQMKLVDPKIFNLLQNCLNRLAKIEQIDENALTRSFEAKTGYSLASC
ncbi:hypothetical protein [Aliikangiella sp. IMCC44359]|uniref:hypothetical protein n=1 Tax=Aliikangiella sp. IMCC44359 TaxID=3459125 RepID=UPI00403A80C7